MVAAALVINFSKGTNPFTETTLLHLKTKNVDGLKRNSVVLMAGVPVGSISAIHLDTDTGIVTLDAKIKAEYQIRDRRQVLHRDRRFSRRQIHRRHPRRRTSSRRSRTALTVICQESFDLVRAARSATDLMDELKTVASQITNIVNRIDSKLLDEQTLTNLAAGLSNLREISAEASATIAGVNQLILTNTPPINAAIENVVTFSEQLKNAGGDLQNLINTNSVVIDESLANIKKTTESLHNLVAAAEQGKGLAGKLFSDEELASNFSLLSSNLVDVSVKLNRGGLWSILWADKNNRRRQTHETQADHWPQPPLMAKPTDIRAAAAELFFLPVETRVPLKFGPETLTHVTCARARLTVRLANGGTATGWGETPLSVQWVWPSALPYEPRHQALKEFLHPPGQSVGGIRRPGPFAGTGPRLPANRTAQAARRLQRRKPRRRTDAVARRARMLLALRHRAARRAWPSTWPADLRDVHARVPQPRPWPVPRAGQRLRHQLRRSVP